MRNLPNDIQPTVKGCWVKNDQSNCILGNYFNGVAVNNCIYHSIKAAEDLLQVQTSHDRLIATKF